MSAAVATLLSHDSACYEASLLVFVCSFVRTRSSLPLVVVHSVPLPSGILELARDNVSFQRVETISNSVVLDRHYHLQTSATKLHMWNLTQFSRVAFFDVDHVFVDNIDRVFQECGAPFCAVSDVEKNEFNGGFFVMRPSAVMHVQLLRAYSNRAMHMNPIDARATGDQKFLNVMFRAWTPLNSTFNAQKGTQGEAVHHKIWKRFPYKWLDMEAVVNRAVGVRHRELLDQMLDRCLHNREATGSAHGSLVVACDQPLLCPLNGGDGAGHGATGHIVIALFALLGLACAIMPTPRPRCCATNA